MPDRQARNGFQLKDMSDMTRTCLNVRFFGMFRVSDENPFSVWLSAISRSNLAAEKIIRAKIQKFIGQKCCFLRIMM